MFCLTTLVKMLSTYLLRNQRMAREASRAGFKLLMTITFIMRIHGVPFVACTGYVCEKVNTSPPQTLNSGVRITWWNVSATCHSYQFVSEDKQFQICRLNRLLNMLGSAAIDWTTANERKSKHIKGKYGPNNTGIRVSYNTALAYTPTTVHKHKLTRC